MLSRESELHYFWTKPFYSRYSWIEIDNCFCLIVIRDIIKLYDGKNWIHLQRCQPR